MKTSTHTLSLVLLIFLAGGICEGQIAENPAKLVSQNALFYLDISDTRKFILDCKKNWYDPNYRSAISDGNLRGLELSGPAQYCEFLARMIEEKQRTHWLNDIVMSINQPENETVEALNAGFEELLSGSEPNLEMEDDLVTFFADMFPGRLVVAVEDKKPNYRTMFAIEFERELFDWFEEFKLAAAKQTKDEEAEPVEVVGDIEVFLVPKEEVYFFAYKDVLYGVCDTDIEYCKQFINRLTESGGDQGKFKSLYDSRRFQRVAKRLENEMSEGAFCFLNFETLLARSVLGPKVSPTGNRLPTKRQYIKAAELKAGAGRNDFTKYPGNVMGVLINFGKRDNLMQTRVVYPIIQPPNERLTAMLNGLEVISSDQDRLLIGGMASQVYSQPLGALKQVDCGQELFCSSWAVKRDPRNSQPAYVTRRLPSPFGAGELPDREFCRFTLPIVEGTKPSGRPDVRLNNGYYLEIPYDELMDEAQPMFESESFKYFCRQFGRNVGMGGKIKGIDNSYELPSKVSEFGLMTDSEVQFTQYGLEKPVFAAGEIGNGSVMFGLPNTEAGRTQVADLLGQSKRYKVNLEDVFAGGLEDYGELRAVVFQQQFASHDIALESVYPLSLAFSDSVYDPNELGFRNIYFANDQLVLFRLYRSLMLSAFHSSPGQNENVSICAMAISADRDVVEYHSLSKKLSTLDVDE
jgi:hypothetical protein